MFYKISAILTTDVTSEYYKNTEDNSANEIEAVNIVLCNLTNAAVTVFVSFPPNAGTFQQGAILYGYSLAANSFIPLGNRFLNLDNRILAYAGSDDAITLSMDITGEKTGQYEPLT